MRGQQKDHEQRKGEGEGDLNSIDRVTSASTGFPCVCDVLALSLPHSGATEIHCGTFFSLYFTSSTSTHTCTQTHELTTAVSLFFCNTYERSELKKV